MQRLADCQTPLGHVTEMTGHVPEFGGHDAETVGHDGPKYALYGPRTTPIVGALVGENSATELQQLLRIPRFGSFLGRVMEEHVAHMRALGYRFDASEDTLLRFDRFLQRHPESIGLKLNELVELWSEEQPSPNHLFEARRAGRMVSKAMHRLDPRVPILPIGQGVAEGARQGQRTAHLYTDDEIQRVLGAALSYPSPKAPLRPLTLFTMLVLAYCAGLRGGEIVRLRLGDVDQQEETIDIHETKFFSKRSANPLPRPLARPSASCYAVTASAQTG